MAKYYYSDGVCAYKSYDWGRKLHREDGPAVIADNGDKEWWINGKLHRLDGPAIITHKLQYYCIDGYHLFKEDFEVHPKRQKYLFEQELEKILNQNDTL